MIVKELIEKLQNYPDDFKVNVWIEAEILADFEYPVLGVYDQREEINAVDLIIDA